MDILFERHTEYLSDVPMRFVRELAGQIDWDSRLILIRGPKGVGKSTLMLQYILKHFGQDNHNVLYCSADSAYFLQHTILETVADFVRRGGKYLFIDEIHKYEGWSREIKEVYDLYKGLKLVLSGSSLIQLNDGQADVYDMYGLSFREYLRFRTGVAIEPISLENLLSAPNAFCTIVKKQCRPLEFFYDYLKSGYYPFSFERPKTYGHLVENIVRYIIEYELVKYRGVSCSNTRKILALVQVISGMLPYLVDISKLSRNVGIDRVTIMNYLKYLDEAGIIRNLYTETDKISDLQKPDKILLDNTNILYAFSAREPEIGTVRETFFCNQLASAGHKVEYGGIKTGDFRIDNDMIIEVGGIGKNFSQIDDNDISNCALALDNIDTASSKKIPLWCFGCLY